MLLPGPQSSRLLVDRARGKGRPLLVGVLAADEPPANARLLASHYLADPSRGRCRPLRKADVERLAPEAAVPPGPVAADWQRQLRAAGTTFSLGLRGGELRWHARRGRSLAVVSVRRVVGELESYEPALALTRGALRRFAGRSSPSAARLGEELRRLERTPFVLNRRLREAVLAQVEGGVSFSEIAIRCGRVKREGRGSVCGATTWLARRIGLIAEHGSARPSPWVHAEVLALIARAGLGVAPREVETA